VPSRVSPRLIALLEAEPLASATALDVGTGQGPLALALAPRCRRVIGVDRDPAVIEEARRRARMAGADNVEFAVLDAERDEYTPFAPDLVAAHLCMSDAIAERAGRALETGRVLALVAFHADQWQETGRRSRFAYDEAQMAALLERTGFRVEHLEIERDVQRFASVEAGLAAAIGVEERWRADGRWVRYLKFLEDGGRTLTRAHLVVKARRW
jgi:predicted TPR repeat methyltransferase